MTRELFDSAGRPLQSNLVAGEWLAAVIAGGQQVSAEIDLGDNYSNLNVIIPLVTQADLTIYTSRDSGGIFQALDNAFYSGTGQVNSVVLTGGWRYLKIFSSVAQGAERTLYIRGINL